MKQRLVYRLETAKGVGAFQAVDIEWFAALHPAHNDPKIIDRDFPTPADDPKLRDHFVGIPSLFLEETEGLNQSGCCSVEQLRKWFPPEVAPVLEDAKVEFTVWRVPDNRVLDGVTQAVFDRSAAECIKREPVTALWAEAREAA